MTDNRADTQGLACPNREGNSLMDERKIEAPQRTSASSEQLPLDSKVLSINGGEIRIDRAHASNNIGDSALAADRLRILPRLLHLPLAAVPNSTRKRDGSSSRSNSNLHNSMNRKWRSKTAKQASMPPSEPDSTVKRNRKKPLWEERRPEAGIQRIRVGSASVGYPMRKLLAQIEIRSIGG